MASAVDDNDDLSARVYRSLSRFSKPPSSTLMRETDIYSLSGLLTLRYEAAIDDWELPAAPVNRGGLTRVRWNERKALWAALDSGDLIIADMKRREVAQLILRLTDWQPATVRNITDFLDILTDAGITTTLLREVATVLYTARGFHIDSYDCLHAALVQFNVSVPLVVRLCRGVAATHFIEPRSPYCRALLIAAALMDMWIMVHGQQGLRALEAAVLGQCRQFTEHAGIAHLIDTRPRSTYLLHADDHAAAEAVSPSEIAASAAVM